MKLNPLETKDARDLGPEEEQVKGSLTLQPNDKDILLGQETLGFQVPVPGLFQSVIHCLLNVKYISLPDSRDHSPGMSPVKESCSQAEIRNRFTLYMDKALKRRYGMLGPFKRAPSKWMVALPQTSMEVRLGVDL